MKQCVKLLTYCFWQTQKWGSFLHNPVSLASSSICAAAAGSSSWSRLTTLIMEVVVACARPSFGDWYCTVRRWKIVAPQTSVRVNVKCDRKWEQVSHSRRASHVCQISHMMQPPPPRSFMSEEPVGSPLWWFLNSPKLNIYLLTRALPLLPIVVNLRQQNRWQKNNVFSSKKLPQTLFSCDL